MYFNATLKFKIRNILTYISNNDNLANQNLFFSIVRKRFLRNFEHNAKLKRIIEKVFAKPISHESRRTAKYLFSFLYFIPSPFCSLRFSFPLSLSQFLSIFFIFMIWPNQAS